MNRDEARLKRFEDGHRLLTPLKDSYLRLCNCCKQHQRPEMCRRRPGRSGILSKSEMPQLGVDEIDITKYKNAGNVYKCQDPPVIALTRRRSHSGTRSSFPVSHVQVIPSLHHAPFTDKRYAECSKPRKEIFISCILPAMPVLYLAVSDGGTWQSLVLDSCTE